jgi:hypothetical protein
MKVLRRVATLEVDRRYATDLSFLYQIRALKCPASDQGPLRGPMERGRLARTLGPGT